MTVDVRSHRRRTKPNPTSAALPRTRWQRAASWEILVGHGRERVVLSATATGGAAPSYAERCRSFITSGGRLAADADGFVRYAQVIVSLHDRRAVEVLRVGFYQYRALTDGTLDREHFREIMAVIPEAAFGWLRISQPPQGVVSAEHKFAQRRLEHMSRWKATRADHAKLRELVNRRAGREIM
jgi:hypothetical protein